MFKVKQMAKMLDIAIPGWENEINLDTLSLYSSEQCILGQVLEGRTISGGKVIVAPWYRAGWFSDRRTINGVTIHGASTAFLSEINKPVWVREIKKRRRRQSSLINNLDLRRAPKRLVTSITIPDEWAEDRPLVNA